MKSKIKAGKTGAGFWTGCKDGLGAFGKNISTIINSVLLLLTYIIAVGLTAIVAKISGKHFLEFGKKDSYWRDVPKRKNTLEECYRQF